MELGIYYKFVAEIIILFNIVDAFLYFYYPGDEVREDGGGYAVRLNDQ